MAQKGNQRQTRTDSGTVKMDKSVVTSVDTRGQDRAEALVSVKNESHACEFCFETFTGKNEFESHMLLHLPFGDRPFRCETCGKTFKESYQLKEHMNTHLIERPYRCHLCGKCLSAKKTLKSHIANHTGNKKHSCTICEKTFFYAGGLKEHMAVHSSEKSHMCEICGKSFAKKSALGHHQLVHTDVRPFKCEMCEKMFRLACDLKVHMRYHRGEQPFECEQCGKTFYRAQYLKKHLLVHEKKRKISTQHETVAKCVDSDSGHARKGSSDVVLKQVVETPYIDPEEDDGGDRGECDSDDGCSDDFIGYPRSEETHPESQQDKADQGSGEHDRYISVMKEVPVQPVDGAGEMEDISVAVSAGDSSEEGTHHQVLNLVEFHDSGKSLLEHNIIRDVVRDVSCQYSGEEKQLHCKHTALQQESQHETMPNILVQSNSDTIFITATENHKTVSGVPSDLDTLVITTAKYQPKTLPNMQMPSDLDTVVITTVPNHIPPPELSKPDDSDTKLMTESHPGQGTPEIRSEEKCHVCDTCGKGFGLHDLKVHKCERCKTAFEPLIEDGVLQDDTSDEDKSLTSLEVINKSIERTDSNDDDKSAKLNSNKSGSDIRKENQNKKEQIMCSVCGKMFRFPVHLKKHMIAHTENRPFQCPHCDKNFKTPMALNLHSRVHTKEKPYACNICGICFAQKSTRNLHKNTVHLGLRPFKCNVCGKTYGRRSHLIEHRQSHVGFGPTHKSSYCKLCEKSISNHAMKEHMRKHSGERPLKCLYCDKTFAWARAHRRHMKTHSG
ncbi:zinc finger protein 431-like [Haliotis rubra]|uniref:zinc finger protein 431-like n=1 Tax=Haliotis rubra TaxID=36100 RepID=UPI001EE5FE11|nr:zinc finger protein 431-like [Haliotis rubra]